MPISRHSICAIARRRAGRVSRPVLAVLAVVVTGSAVSPAAAAGVLAGSGTLRADSVGSAQPSPELAAFEPKLERSSVARQWSTTDWDQTVRRERGTLPASRPDKASRIRDLSKKVDVASGVVEVMVDLRVAVAPEGFLSVVERREQRADIASARRRVVAALVGTLHRVTHSFEGVGAVVLEVSPEGLERLAASPDVLAAHIPKTLAPALASSVPLVGAPTAWGLGSDGAGQAIVVIDTGVATSHPFLAGRVDDNLSACFSSTASCPNGSLQQKGPGAAVPCAYSAECDHGTHVAGIAAGANGGLGAHGVAKGATVVAIQAASRFDQTSQCAPRLAPCALFQDPDLVAALQYVHDQVRFQRPVAAVNMSLGGGNYPIPCDAFASSAVQGAISNLRSVGIAVVVASANMGTSGIAYPACLSGAVSVGATDVADQVTSFSNSAAG